ncbi:MAG: helix-turn-helix domain-containing protein [Akkermansiaceae bacterium]|nr:helix-turn-helix domain-containing protein [Akkermansiaceae bacterium]
MSDPFEQIGPKLTQAREAKGLELAEAARQAQVPRPAAEALEAENFSYFDSPVYAKSFLLQYSEFLGVDAHTWLEALEPGSFMASGALLKGPEPPTRRQRPEESDSQSKGGAMAVIILLAVTAAIIYGVIKGFEYFEAQHGQEPAKEQIEKPEPAQ